MKAVGIIAEYNPYHNGHAWHVKQAKKLSDCQGVIAVMSGQFLQRGEPASFDKWRRAKMAVLGGVDLVIELPAAFAVRSAQYFAEGGVRLLDSLGIVSHLCFGAECDDLPLLQSAAQSVHNDKTVDQLKQNMKNGHTYAKAFSQSVGDATGLVQSVLSSPNNILAIEYLRALSRFAPQITPIAIKRKSAQYHDTSISGEVASATAIRRALENTGSVDEQLCRVIPPSTADLLKISLTEGYGPVCMENLALPLLYVLRTLPWRELEQIPGMNEGLHFKAAATALKASSLAELLKGLKSKRYTATSLQRMCIHTLLGTKKQDMAAWSETGPLYARVLAFNENGRDMLRAIGKHSDFPLVTKTANVLNSRTIGQADLNPLEKMLALDVKASDIYALAMPNPRLRFGGWEFLHSPAYVPLALKACVSPE